MENYQNGNNGELKNQVNGEAIVNANEAKAVDEKKDKAFKILKIVGCGLAIVGICVGAFFGITACCGGTGPDCEA